MSKLTAFAKGFGRVFIRPYEKANKFGKWAWRFWLLGVLTDICRAIVGKQHPQWEILLWLSWGLILPLMLYAAWMGIELVRDGRRHKREVAELRDRLRRLEIRGIVYEVMIEIDFHRMPGEDRDKFLADLRDDVSTTPDGHRKKALQEMIDRLAAASK